MNFLKALKYAGLVSELLALLGSFQVTQNAFTLAKELTSFAVRQLTFAGYTLGLTAHQVRLIEEHVLQIINIIADSRRG